MPYYPPAGSSGYTTVQDEAVALTQRSTLNFTGAGVRAATLTLPAAGAGLFHYITGLWVTRNATATLVITSTNLPGTMAWSVGNAMSAGGTQHDISMTPASPIKSSVANTATTVVMPAPGAAVLWRGYAAYYVGA